jgi:hypothetical protein
MNPVSPRPALAASLLFEVARPLAALLRFPQNLFSTLTN